MSKNEEGVTTASTLDEKMKQRAARFGVEASATADATEPKAAKHIAKAEGDVLDPEKAKKRAERFATPEVR